MDKLYLEIIERILNSATNIFTIIASVIAIYIFVFKRKVVYSVFRVLINYSSQMTLTEFKYKLDKLNDLNANDDEKRDEVINIFNEILGQIRGSKKLNKHFKEILPKVKSIAEGKRNITEPRKRSLVSELREMIKDLDIDVYSEIIGE